MSQFFVIKHTTEENEYLTDVNPTTWGEFEDAMWTDTDQETAFGVITTNNIEDAEVEGFYTPGSPELSGDEGGTAPPSKPPF